MRVHHNAIFSILSLALVCQGETVTRAEYVGGTVSELRSGAAGSLRASADIAEFRTGKSAVRVGYDRINLLEYGQNASRRIVLAVVVSPMFLLSKSRRHFLTIGFSDEAGQQQALVFRVDKGQVRAMIASLEARTGLRVQYQDDEARKGGRG